MQTTARVRRRPTQVKPVNRHSVLRSTMHRSHHHRLVHSHLAVMPVTAFTPELALNVDGRQYAVIDYV